MKKIAALTLSTVAAFATPALSADWNGAYVGAQIGFGNYDATGSDSGVTGGLVAGYDIDFGQGVIGAGIDYDWSSVGDAGRMYRLKVRGGAEVSETSLLYVTAGYANLDIDGFGDDGGYFIGAGYEQKITESFSIGGEYLYHRFNDFKSTNEDVTVNTIQLRGTFRF